MQARESRGDRVLPTLSGQTLSGVMALLAVLGLGTTALSSLQPERRVLGPVAPRPASPTPAAPAVSASGPSEPEDAASAPPGGLASEPPPPRTPNHAPVVHRVDFTVSRLTALGDLRLAIEAVDPDGDPIELRTTWWVSGVALETPTPMLPRDRFSRGDRIRASIVAFDGSRESEPLETHEVVVSNAAPRITSFPTGFDATGAFVYPLGAVDPDGDLTLEYRLLEGPEGMRLEAHEGTLSWRPRADQIGRHAVRIEVHDGRGGREVQAFALQVTRPGAAVHALGER